MPVSVKIKREDIELSKNITNKEKIFKEVLDVSEEGIDTLKNNLREMKENGELENEDWTTAAKKIKNAGKYIRIKEKNDEKEKWWDVECEKEKKKVNKELKKYRNEVISINEFKEVKKDYRRKINMKKRFL